MQRAINHAQQYHAESLFLYSYEADSVQHLQKVQEKFKKKKPAYNVTFVCIDDVLFNYYIDVIYPEEKL